jgi:hypothetical protein
MYPQPVELVQIVMLVGQEKIIGGLVIWITVTVKLQVLLFGHAFVARTSTVLTPGGKQ